MTSSTPRKNRHIRADLLAQDGNLVSGRPRIDDRLVGGFVVNAQADPTPPPADHIPGVPNCESAWFTSTPPTGDRPVGHPGMSETGIQIPIQF